MKQVYDTIQKREFQTILAVPLNIIALLLLSYSINFPSWLDRESQGRDGL